jgi:RHS repeat-associated protein
LSVQAQTAEFTQNTKGSNAMTMQVPLANYPGRGVSLPVTLHYSTSGLWRIGFINSVYGANNIQAEQPVAEAIYAEHSTAGWTTSLDVPEIEWPKGNDLYWYTGKPYTHGWYNGYTFRIARVFIHMPGGETHELRRSDQVYSDSSVEKNGNFYAVDDSRMRYDGDISTLFMPDGTRYVFNGSTTQYIDRNGNTLNYDATNRQWTDTMGRVIGMPWPANPGAGNYTYSIPGFAQSTSPNSSVTISYTLKFSNLSDVLLPDVQGQTLKPMGDYYLSSPAAAPGPGNLPQGPLTSGSTMFTSSYASPDDPDENAHDFTYLVGRGQSGTGNFNPVVLAEIDLPNGQNYKFSYNAYGELDKVIYPTGGYQRYQYGTVSAIGFTTLPYTEGTRGRLSRWVSPNGTGLDEAQWTYSATNWPLTVTEPDASGAPNGTRTESYVYNASSSQSNNFGYTDARNGLPSEERVYAPQSEGGAMLRRKLIDYAQTSNTISKPNVQNQTGTFTAYRNARATKTVSLILDTGGDALAKTITHEYASNGYELTTGLNRTASTESYFASVASSTAQTGTIDTIQSGTSASRAETTYLNDSAYLSRNILGLPTSFVLMDGNQQAVSRTESFYDESAYSQLTYGDLTGSDYTDPNTTARGNVTTVRRYLDVSAAVSAGEECPAGVCLNTHAFFDQVGNAWKAKNERGIESSIDYPSTYKHAFTTQTNSAVPDLNPDPNGRHGSNTAFTSSSIFDYNTGLVMTATDANSQVTTFSYTDESNNVDSLDRLRKVTRPDGGWTKYSFGETLGNLYTMTEAKLDASRTVKSYQYADPLGRATRSFAGEGGNSYIAADTIYDKLGRVWKVSNPYRTTTMNGTPDLSHTSDWTVSHYDMLSRVDYVTLPDASMVQTAYQGIYTTVTDQAGRQRRQKTDALGRIVRVDEPDTSGSLGTVDSPAQPSYYDYNTQGSLIHITQGVGSTIQNRYFKYDALGRLTYERQVEQAGTFTASDALTGNSSWSRHLVYDVTINSVNYAGLLTTATDARNISTQFQYDQLNRIYQVNYSDGTPTVTNNYDQARTGYFNKGRLTEALTASTTSLPSTSEVYNFDLMGRVTNNQQTVGDQSYSMSYDYNLGGALRSETYPSNRVVSYEFDDGARLSQVSSGSTVYANQFDYSSSQGLLKSVALGNGAVESYGYNSRLQMKSIDLTKSGTQLQHYDYKYGVYDPATNTLDETKDNGQIARIEGTIATQKQWQQNFAYDSLGRLSSAREFRGDNSAQSWLVNYNYDVFANRYQYQSQNGSNPFSPVWVESGQISQSSNRFTSGVTYDDAGNITVDSKFRNLQFQYDANNRQKQSANSDGTGAVVSVYDAGGQRVATQVGGALTNILVYDASGKLLAEYGSSAPTGGTQYLFSDHQGSPRAITSASGGVISRHDYAPFGEEIGSLGMRASGQGYGAGDNARQKYAGMESDDGSGMATTLWRKFDSSSGRWTSLDPYGGSMSVASPQSFNRYSYVSNDPVNMRDPSGLMRTQPQGDPETVPGPDDRDPPGDPFETGRSITGAQEARYERTISDRNSEVGLGDAKSALADAAGEPQNSASACPVAVPTDLQELTVAEALMGELLGEGTPTYAPEDHTTVSKGKNHNPKAKGEETYGLVIGEAWEMVSAINNRAKEKGKSWSDIVNEKQSNGDFQIEGYAKQRGPAYIKLIGTDSGLCTRLLAIETAISMVKQTGGDPRFNYWKGVRQPADGGGAFVRNLNGVRGALTPGAVRLGATDFYRAAY